MQKSGGGIIKMLLSEGDGPMKGYNYPAFTSDLGDPGDKKYASTTDVH